MCNAFNVFMGIWPYTKIPIHTISHPIVGDGLVSFQNLGYVIGNRIMLIFAKISSLFAPKIAFHHAIFTFFGRKKAQ